MIQFLVDKGIFMTIRIYFNSINKLRFCVLAYVFVPLEGRAAACLRGEL
jgi:hypothetical protein